MAIAPLRGVLLPARVAAEPGGPASSKEPNVSAVATFVADSHHGRKRLTKFKREGLGRILKRMI